MPAPASPAGPEQSPSQPPEKPDASPVRWGVDDRETGDRWIIDRQTDKQTEDGKIVINR